ncbi:response regulator, partial [Thermodesulfobacteriota bacterium]
WFRGEKFHVVDKEEKLRNFFNEPIYRKPMLEQEPFLGEITWVDGFSLPFIDVSLPVKDRTNGTVSGIVRGRFSFQTVQTILERYLPPQGKIFLIASDNGATLAAADDTAISFTDQKSAVLEEILQDASKRGRLIKMDKSADGIFIFRKFSVDNHELLLLYFQPHETIYFLANRFKLHIVLVLLSGIGAFVLVSLILVRRSIYPLTELTRRISELERRYRPGGVNGPIEQLQGQGDEIEVLDSAFTSFQEELLIYSREIEGFNQKLEQEVAEKTTELAELNRSLEALVAERTAELSMANTALLSEIDEREKAQTAVAAEKEQLAVTLRSIGDGVITTETESNVVLLNRIAEELTGWTQEEASGRPLWEVFRLVEDQSGEFGSSGDGVLQSRDGGRRKIAQSSATILNEEGTVIGVVLVFRDVTEKRLMEEELLKARKLESIGVLAGGIAHDFNNIMVAVLGNINLARLKLINSGTDEPLLEEAEKASLRARDLTQQLLTFAKGGDPVRKARSIKEVIRDNADFVLRGSNVRCNYAFPDDLWPVEIDAGQISQVIQNIVINAKQAMPMGGELQISCRNLPIEKNTFSLPAGAYVEIAIQDQGIGIQAGLLDKIFDPYFSTKQKGSGLGLAITHSIISKHEGIVLVDSLPENGTTFTIILPAGEAGQPEAAVAMSAAKTLSQGRILVMDDEEQVREVLKTMLMQLGNPVVVAEDGAEAIAQYQKHLDSDEPFDLVILDLTVPGGMGGLEALREILRLHPEARVMVSSGYSNDPVISRYQEYGFCAALSKPFQMDELTAALGSIQ